MFLFLSQLLHEVITEGISCSSRTQKRTRSSSTNSDNGSSVTEDSNDIILQRLTNLVEVVEQSKVGHSAGKIQMAN